VSFQHMCIVAAAAALLVSITPESTSLLAVSKMRESLDVCTSGDGSTTPACLVIERLKV
jgi:hypothetical protein